MSRFAASAALALVAAAGQAQVYSISPAAPIPATGTAAGTISSTLAVAGAPASITDLNVILNITHSYDSDLDVIWFPPRATCTST